MKVIMEKYAVIRSGSKQYLVKEGSDIEIEKLPGKVGTTVKFSDVLLKTSEEGVVIGNPTIKNLEVEGTILEQKKGEKIRVATYKAKSRYRKVKGHRQQLTKVNIKKISESKSNSKVELATSKKTKKQTS